MPSLIYGDHIGEQVPEPWLRIASRWECIAEDDYVISRGVISDPIDPPTHWHEWHTFSKDDATRRGVCITCGVTVTFGSIQQRQTQTMQENPREVFSRKITRVRGGPHDDVLCSFVSFHQVWPAAHLTGATFLFPASIATVCTISCPYHTSVWHAICFRDWITASLAQTAECDCN